MSTNGSGGRWRRRLLWVVGGWVTLRVTMTLVFRMQNPRVIDAVRGFNKRVLNPAMLRLAGHRHWYAARLEHVGRRSGRAYSTPVVAQRVEEGFAIPLPYGTDVDWLRNLLAAGKAVLEVDGVRHAVSDPRVVDTAELLGELTWVYRFVSRQYAIRHWVVVTEVTAPAAAA